MDAVINEYFKGFVGQTGRSEKKFIYNKKADGEELAELFVEEVEYTEVH